ncbi:MAG: hypothetical protein WC548_00360 [Candidatus Pacearchaeota archaeon]
MKRKISGNFRREETGADIVADVVFRVLLPAAFLIGTNYFTRCMVEREMRSFYEPIINSSTPEIVHSDDRLYEQIRNWYKRENGRK